MRVRVRRPEQTKSTTRLAQIRVWRDKTQAEVAQAIGISERTYRRLESGRWQNPPIRYLVNAALALGVKLEHVLEPEWLEWHVFSVAAAAPPDRDTWMPPWRRREPPSFVDAEPPPGEL